MPLIIESIPKQAFEVVGEQIGAILAMEIANQITLKGLLDVFNAFNERSVPYDKGEGVMLNVMYDGTNRDQHTQAHTHGGSLYHIDIYGTSPSSLGKRGDTESSKLVQRYAGWVDYILSSTKYNILLLPQGIIGGTSIENIQMWDVEGNQDGRNVRMARIAFRVRIFENNPLWESAPLSENLTNVKLGDTDLGYKYEYIK